MGATALAPPQLTEVSLSVFSGQDTELAPIDCPEGLSTDNQDVIYKPGEVDSRECLQKLFPNGTGAPILYHKTYDQPNDDPLTLFLDANGIIWVEDVQNSPETYTKLSSVPAGLYAQSVSAFGREYIAISDLLHGQSVPLQYNGQWLDRVTQDGPGAGPVVSNYLNAAAVIQGTGAPIVVNIAASPTGIVWGGEEAVVIGYDPKPIIQLIFTYFTVTTSAPHGLTAGQKVTLAGSTSSPSLNSTWTVASTPTASTFTVNYSVGVAIAANGGGGTVTQTASANSLTRTSNTVLATTATAHGFQVGWQVQISGIGNTNIGGGIAAIARDGNGVVTVTTTTPHGLGQGDLVCIVGVSNPDASFNVASIAVASVPSPTTFTYQQGGTAESSSIGSGNVQDIWDVTDFIQSVPTATTFTYQQLGPNDATSNTGLATIVGQISPGPHQLVVIFLTRNGALTQPSPPVPFSANGGQQAALSQIPTGPPNVVARLIGATGAGGDNFFTIPAVPQVGGQVVGTSFLIPDNVTTSAIIDFSDNTLFDSIAIDQIGNDLFDQRVLGPVLAFFSYGSRLFTYGDFEKVENLLNMGFCGGPRGTTPLGWTVIGSLTGAVVNAGAWPDAQAWQIQMAGAGTFSQIEQPAYQDAFGTSILLPSTSYLLRCWAITTNQAGLGSLVVDVYSPSVGLLMTASIPAADISLTGGFVQVPFSAELPSVIPPDTVLRVYGLGTGGPNFIIQATELELVYAQNPYNDSLDRVSYVENPEGFAQTTGNLGPEDDTTPIRCHSLQRNNVLLKTAGGTHTFQQTDAEPDQWTVNQLSRSVGASSIRAGDPGQFGTGDAAEDWDVTLNQNGLYLFAGGEFWKVSQEVAAGRGSQPTLDSINWAAQQTIVVKNDVHRRRILMAVPINGATQPNIIFVADYRELDTAAQISGSPPIHISLTGKMWCSDLTRKWTRWNLAINSMEVLIRPGNFNDMFFGGNFGNLYNLNANKFTDDDYGQMFPYYTTYFAVSREQETALQLGAGRKMLKKVTAFITGVGLTTFVPLVNSMNNSYPALSLRQLSQDTNSANLTGQDLEWTTGVRGERIALQLRVQPLPGSTDVQFRLQHMAFWMMQDPVAKLRSAII